MIFGAIRDDHIQIQAVLEKCSKPNGIFFISDGHCDPPVRQFLDAVPPGRLGNEPSQLRWTL